MVDDTLQRLLETEMQAEALVAQALEERERTIAEASAEAEAAERRFTARIPEIQSSFLDKAEEKAAQTIAELERRYAERAEELRDMAGQCRIDAVQAALEAFLDSERG